jgi:hypothetical protein
VFEILGIRHLPKFFMQWLKPFPYQHNLKKMVKFGHSCKLFSGTILLPAPFLKVLFFPSFLLEDINPPPLSFFLGK